MHIEIRMPRLTNSTSKFNYESKTMAVGLIKSSMREWHRKFPSCDHSILVESDKVTIRFDNPANCSLWAMTWDDYRGNYHSTSWKRISIVDDA